MSQFPLEQARLHLHLHLPGVYRVTSLPVHLGLRQRLSRLGGQQPRLQGLDTVESPLSPAGRRPARRTGVKLCGL